MSSLFSTFFLPIPVDGSSILRQIFKYNFTGYANPLAIIIVVQTGSIRGGGGGGLERRSKVPAVVGRGLVIVARRRSWCHGDGVSSVAGSVRVSDVGE